MEKIIRFSVSLPENLLTELDSRVVNGSYSSRSELVRDLIREKIVDDTWEAGEGEVVGVLTIVYDHHQRELAQRMIQIQHDSLAKILCTTHVHIDHHNCIETILFRGLAHDIEVLAGEIGGLRGVQFAKLTKATSF
ncbi:MAG: nickel-responsive transcriptional regulator NikR [Wolinella sp.]